MSEFIMCGVCGFRGLEIGSTICFLCNNNCESKYVNKTTKNMIEKKFQIPDDDLEEEKIYLYEKYKSVHNFPNVPKHPSLLMESSLLSSIPVRRCNEFLLNKDGVIKKRCVSNIQLESILLILTKFEEYFQYTQNGYNNRMRYGFFLGDGTGCGKGRVIAGVIDELRLTNGFEKCVWLSVSQDLENDSKRDLHDVQSGMKTMNLLDKEYEETGVMFSTYNTIVKYKRYNDLCEWLGKEFEGLIVFDESHKAKQCLKNKSKTAQVIIELQEKYPKARILYVSATGFSTVEHMGYMIKLNMWGNKIHNNLKEFVDDTSGSDFASEMVAMYLKKQGMYIARSLSYKKVTTGVTLIKTSEFESIYNESIRIVNKIRMSGLIKGKMKMIFGSSILRFYRTLLLTFKIDKTIQIIEKCLEENMCAIVTLQSTWESYQNNDDIFDAPKIILIKFINFIRDIYEEKNDIKSCKQCDDILKDVHNLQFGNNMNIIDKIIHFFGEDKIAEITGRKKKYNMNNKIVNRSLTNLEEKDKFMNGEKDICIISEAGSVGISLHDTNGKKRRFHIIIELPWSAEQFIQQCGRSHRSGQKSSPHYQIIITNLPSESRFLSIILKRLRTLGALTNGNRFIKTEMFDLGNDYESLEGEMAMKYVLENIINEEIRDVFGFPCDKVSRFFNRMMLLSIGDQEKIYNHYNTAYIQYCNDDKLKNNKNEINDIRFSRLVNETIEHINEGVELKKIEFEYAQQTYKELENNIGSKNILLLEEKGYLIIAVKININSDLYNILSTKDIRRNIVNFEYISKRYSIYKHSDETFQNEWDNQISKNKYIKNVSFISGNLYDIRLKLNKHTCLKQLRLKRFICLDNKYNELGFVIYDNIKQLLKQIL